MNSCLASPLSASARFAKPSGEFPEHRESGLIMTINVRLIGLLLALAAMTATHASAGQGWEIEAHGGVVASTNPTSGTATLPPIGPNIPLFGSGNTSSTR